MMPTYEMDPNAWLAGEDQKIPQPDDSHFYMETPSLLAAINPFTSDQRIKRAREAAFRMDNTLGSFIARTTFSQFDPVDGYNPFDNDAEEIKDYEDYADAFIHSRSQDETRAIKQRIDKQLSDRQLLS